MAETNSASMNTAGSDLVVTRVFDAPRRLVFEAWTDPRHLKQWWAPKGCSTPFCTVDLRPGGIFHYCMRMPDGRDIWGIAVYREIVAPERIVYSDSFADERGNPVSPTTYGMSPGHPEVTLVTVTFMEEGGRTAVTLRHSIPPSVLERGAVAQGWNEMLDGLSEYLLSA